MKEAGLTKPTPTEPTSGGALGRGELFASRVPLQPLGARGHTARISPQARAQGLETQSNLTPLIYALTFHIRPLTFDIRPLTFDISPLTFDISPLTFDISHLTFDISNLTFDISPLTWRCDPPAHQLRLGSPPWTIFTSRPRRGVHWVSL